MRPRVVGDGVPGSVRDMCFAGSALSHAFERSCYDEIDGKGFEKQYIGDAVLVVIGGDGM